MLEWKVLLAYPNGRAHDSAALFDAECMQPAAQLLVGEAVNEVLASKECTKDVAVAAGGLRRQKECVAPLRLPEVFGDVVETNFGGPLGLRRASTWWGGPDARRALACCARGA
jgi:hypothetical protein